LLSNEPPDVHYAEARYTKGRAYETLGDGGAAILRQALTEYEAAYQAYERTQSAYNRGTVAYDVGRLLLQLASPDEAAKGQAAHYLEEAWRTYTAAGFGSEAKDAAQLLASVRDTPPPVAGTVESATGPEERGGERRMPSEMRAKAMASIRLPQHRPILLKHWIDGHASSKSERAAFLRDWIYVPMLSEAEAAYQEAERRNDPQLRDQAALMEQDAEAFLDYLLSLDAEHDTHPQALEILRRHLGSGTGFVLFLRNFDIDITKARLTTRLVGSFAQHGMQPQFVNMLGTRADSEQERFASLIPEDVPIVAIGDIGDALQTRISARIARLRVISDEWDLVAAMLIGEASAIVFFIRTLTGGTKLEFDLIGDLEAANKTSVILIEPQDDAIEGAMLEGYDAQDRRLSFDVLSGALARRFNDALVQVEQLPKDDDALRRIVTRVLERAHLNP
jgi:hypothetical protein